ncbi:unnamed protein product [Ciceribacter sp. T2.26MG-112.2]|uniref:HD domain-containing protein n=1 Tax=Ciceribacter sp. T2.26MG-112.2 TaxID=3137154 RepID=UPI000E198DF2|nr:HD domain-containing protein [Ciceribacter naphthalenivorans]SSC73052.1 unnamed protein product [Ciceribacter naphthalenivorans]
MQDSVHLDHAVQIAADAHQGQLDKLGRPYFEHCQRVAASMVDEQARTVAYLHDVVEKGRNWTLDRLKEEGFAPPIIAAVDALTRRPMEQDEALVRRAGANPLARRVKQADLEDNLWQAEMAGREKGKYERGLEILSGTASP